MLNLFLQNLGATSRVLLISWSVLLVFEFAFPLERQSRKSYLRGLRNAIVIIPITTLIGTLLFSMVNLLPIQPFLLNLPNSLKPYSPLLGWFLGDICYYWMHRFQHTKFWWHFHNPHHNLKEVNAVNSASHWMEAITGFVFQTFPLMFISIPGEGIPIFSFLFVWGFYIHSNTKVTLGPLRYLFADPKYHRVHHSIEEKHWGKNYAAFFPIIAIVFGTAYFPKNEVLRTKDYQGQKEPNVSLFLR